MTELNTLLDKINLAVDTRIKEVEEQNRQEQKQRENYLKQIKKLSKRITNMLTLVNTLCKNTIPNSQYTYQLLHDLMEKQKQENCPIIFTGREKYSDPPYTYVSLTFKEGCTECRLSVSAEEIKYLYIWSSGGMSENPLEKLKTNRLLEFIVEFQRAETILKEFILNL